MEKVSGLLKAIGLVPGERARRSDLNYGRIVIATDADHDGSHIFALLVNLLYQFWPELFDPQYEPIVYRMVAPNVCLIKAQQIVHFPTMAAYESAKHKYKGWTVKYYKGLGSMNTKDWEMLLADDSACFIPIVDDGQLKPMLQLLFSDDSDNRKNWLTS